MQLRIRASADQQLPFWEATQHHRDRADHRRDRCQLHRNPRRRQDTRSAVAAMSYFFSTPVDIDIVLEDLDDRSAVDVKLDKNRKEKVPLYLDGESVKGQVTVRPKDGKRLEHTGIKVQFIGTIGAWPPAGCWRLECCRSLRLQC